MADDMQDIALSLKAKNVASQFVNDGYFQYIYQAAVFAAAYVIRTEYDSFNPGTYTPFDTMGSNFTYQTVDPNSELEKLIINLYVTDTPHIYLRNLMDYGLEKIGDRIEKIGRIPLDELISSN